MVFRVFLFVFITLLTLPRQLWAQGFFQAFGFPKTAVATGHTEVAGSVHMALRFGTVGADTLVIDVSPLRVTNANASDIRITTSGNLTTGAVTIESAEGRVRVPVNAGGTSGSIRVDGIRVSLTSAGSTSVSARVSWASNQNILDSPASVVVVDRIISGLAVDAVTDHFGVFNSVVFDSASTIVMREGFAAAFVSSSEFGQNTPARIRIRVTDFPTGLRMRFPASVTSNETAATLTTVEGAAVVLPRSDGNTEVTYDFNAAANSSDVLESFNITFTVSTQGVVANLQPTIELSLAPIGAAEPSTAMPSTSVPRFAEESLRALEGTSYIITKTVYWTGIDSVFQNRLFLFNPSSRVANLILTGFAADGEAASVRQTLPANQSSEQSLTEIFGTRAMNLKTIRVQSPVTELLALGTVSGTGLQESTALQDRGLSNFVIPSFGEVGLVHIFNPNSVGVSGTITLRTPTGAIAATKDLVVGPMASVSSTTQDLFGMQATGQIAGSFVAPVVAVVSFGAAETLNIISAQAPVGLPALFVPFFATGAGYETDLTLINTSNLTVTLDAQLVDAQGVVVTGTRRLITMPPSEQLVTSISELFGLRSFRSGYVRILAPQIARAFWTFYPAITGHVRIRTGESGSTAIPLSRYPYPDSFLLGSGVPSGGFQGIALVNPNNSDVNVTLRALSSTGTTLETTTVSLAAGQIFSRLTNELFGISIPERSVIRVTGTAPVVATSITGSLTADVLRSVSSLK
ncbi:MAG: hypothetical protein HYU27_04795 [Acidobacteria bacterium]|nr:hypothetical protein [Acidobacteriota bacterium]